MIELITNGLGRVGAATVRVTGDSMLPTVRPGGRVVLYPVEPAGLHPGDVVAYRNRGDELVLHRVHAVFTDRVITAGDNQLFFDRPVLRTDVVGVARDIGRRPVPTPWPAQPQPATVDVWIIGADPHCIPASVVPAGWRLHSRPAEGVGVSQAVFEEIRTAVDGKPCVGVSEHAVYAADEILHGGLPPQAQVIIGCSYGRLRHPMLGRLIPSETADVHVRLGPPEEQLAPAEAMRRLGALVAPGGPA